MQFIDTATKAGFTISSKPGIVTLSASFTPGDNDAYVKFDCDVYSVLSDLPCTSAGSTWGTTSDGAGGHLGLRDGYYRVSRSGVSKQFTNALARLGA